MVNFSATRTPLCRSCSTSIRPKQEHYLRDLFGHGNEAEGFGMDIELG